MRGVLVHSVVFCSTESFLTRGCGAVTERKSGRVFVVWVIYARLVGLLVGSLVGMVCCMGT